jgi:hypothetical protein
VLVEPSAWLEEDRLESLLLSLPAGADAVIVEADPASEGDSGEG